MNKETQAIIWANAFAIRYNEKLDIEQSVLFAGGVLSEALNKYNSIAQ